MSRSLGFLLAALGILIAVSVMPATRWMLENMAEAVLYGEPAREDGFVIPFGIFGIGPSRNLIDPKQLKGNQDEMKLARALISNDPIALASYAEEHPDDPDAAAYAARVACVRLIRIPEEFGGEPSPSGNSKPVKGAGDLKHGAAPGPAVDPARAELLRRMQAIAARGLQLEPRNAFFAMSEATFLWQGGDVQGAKAIIRRLPSCTEYAARTMEDAKLRQQVVEGYWGYRGEGLRIWLSSGILLPNLASFKNLARAVRRLPRDREGLQLRHDLLVFARTLGEKGDLAIDLLVGSSIADLVTDPGGTKPKNLDQDARFKLVAEHAAAFDAESRRAGIGDEPSASAITSRLVRLVHSAVKVIDAEGTKQDSLARLDVLLLGCAWLIGSLLLGVVVCGALVLANRLRPGSSTYAYPALLALAAAVLTIASYPDMPGIALLLPAAFGAGSVFMLAWFAGLRRKLLSIVSGVLLIGAMTFTTTSFSQVAWNGPLVPYLYGLPVLGILALINLGRADCRRFIGPLALAFAVSVLGYLAMGVRANAVIRQAFSPFTNFDHTEADHIREAAG